MIQLLLRFVEQPIIFTSSMPVRKVPYQNVYLKSHMAHPVLKMWMPSNFDLYNMMHSKVAKFGVRVPHDAYKSYQ